MEKLRCRRETKLLVHQDVDIFVSYVHLYLLLLPPIMWSPVVITAFYFVFLRH